MIISGIPQNLRLTSLTIPSPTTGGIVIGNTVIQQNSNAAYERSRAMQDANRMMEQIRDAASAGNFPAQVVADFGDGETVDGFTGLQDEIVTVDYADTAADPLDVTVTVTWLENGTRDMSVSLQAMVTQR